MDVINNIPSTGRAKLNEDHNTITESLTTQRYSKCMSHTIIYVVKREITNFNLLKLVNIQSSNDANQMLHLLQ
jgi:hypothetical protein